MITGLKSTYITVRRNSCKPISKEPSNENFARDISGIIISRAKTKVGIANIPIVLMSFNILLMLYPFSLFHFSATHHTPSASMKATNNNLPGILTGRGDRCCAMALALSLSHLTFVNSAGKMIAKSAARGHN
jgi:hypothetical protein